MIILPIHAFILLILPTITNQEPVKPVKHIDWTKCGVTANEYATCECLGVTTKSSPSTPLTIMISVAKEEQEKCNIGVQIEYYNLEGAFIQLQVIDGQNTISPRAELGFYQGTTKIFNCISDNGKIKLEGKEEFTNKFRIKLLEGQSHFEPGNVVCAVRMEKASKFLAWIQTNILLSETTNMKFMSINSDEYVLKNPIATSFNRVYNPKCDPFSFADLERSNDYVVRRVINRDSDTLNCNNYGSLFGMRYMKPGLEGAIEIKELKCEKVGTNQYQYTIYKGIDDKGNPSTEKVVKPKSYTFFCAAKFDQLCENPYPDCDSKTNSSCPIYEKGRATVPAVPKVDPVPKSPGVDEVIGSDAVPEVPGAEAKLSCPGKKWLIDEQYYVLDEDPVCKRDDIYDINSAVFYTKLPSGILIKTKDRTHTCFTEYDCMKKSPPNIFPCGDEKACVVPDASNGILQCANDRKLDIYYYKTNQSKLATSYTCNKASGDWVNEVGDTLDLDSQVNCVNGTDEDFGKKEHSEAKLSDSAVYAIIGVVTALVAIALFVGAYFVRRCWIRRTLSAVKENKYWRKMKKPDRIENCKMLFSETLQATPSSLLRITHGFNQIQLLLDEEIQDGECWEEAYPFLMRFQGAIETKDFRIWHMFTRYMYLQAKKILDKHGWLTDKPIRKNKEHGLLRVAAIQMLSFALYDSTNDDAERLVIRGFRKLGFKAVEQYPHCGVLWSVLMNAHASRKFKKKEGSRGEIWWRHDEFVKTLRKISHEGQLAIPAKEVIPVFGSVAEQAALALGNTPNLFFHYDNGMEVIKTAPLQGEAANGTVQLNYFKGICMAPTRNPVPVILALFEMWPDHQPKLLEELHKIAPANSWNELIESTSRMLIYYGRPLDAKRLLDRFMPTLNLDNFLGPLNREQQLFEDALNKHLEEIRCWFATRTDMEILKGKPDYKIDGNKQLDARIDADAAKAEAPAAETDAAAPAPDSAAPAPNAAAPILNAAAPSPNPAARTPNIAAPTPNAAGPAP